MDFVHSINNLTNSKKEDRSQIYNKFYNGQRKLLVSLTKFIFVKNLKYKFTNMYTVDIKINRYQACKNDNNWTFSP